MNNITKRIILLGLTLCMMVGLCSCGMIGALSGLTTQTATDLVQGNLDSLYLGIHDADYLDMVSCTKEEAEEDYQAGLELEAEFFVNYWGIIDTYYGQTFDDVDEDLKNDIIDLYDEIYSYTKYEITSAVRQDDGSFAVKIEIEPIDIMQLAYDVYDTYEPLTTFINSYDQATIDAMTDEEYIAFNNEYGKIIVQMVREQLPNIGYMDMKTQSIQVEEDTDGYYAINSDDLATFDEYVIFYP